MAEFSTIWQWSTRWPLARGSRHRLSQLLWVDMEILNVFPARVELPGGATLDHVRAILSDGALTIWAARGTAVDKALSVTALSYEHNITPQIARAARRASVGILACAARVEGADVAVPAGVVEVYGTGGCRCGPLTYWPPAA